MIRCGKRSRASHKGKDKVSGEMRRALVRARTRRAGQDIARIGATGYRRGRPGARPARERCRGDGMAGLRHASHKSAHARRATALARG